MIGGCDLAVRLSLGRIGTSVTRAQGRMSGPSLSPGDLPVPRGRHVRPDVWFAVECGMLGVQGDAAPSEVMAGEDLGR